MIFSGKVVKNGTTPAIKLAAVKPLAITGVTKGSPQAGSASLPKPDPQAASPPTSAVAVAAGRTLPGAKLVAPATANGTVVPGSSLTTKCQDGLIATGNTRARSRSSSCWW